MHFSSKKKSSTLFQNSNVHFPQRKLGTDSNLDSLKTEVTNTDNNAAYFSSLFALPHAKIFITQINTKKKIGLDPQLFCKLCL